jgi:glutamate dehydrogenase
LGEEEDKITKFQTGGPDGDLGSNEILISKDLILGCSAALEGTW